MNEVNSSRAGSVPRENTLWQSEFRKEAKRATAKINSIDIELGPSESRSSQYYISRFDDKIKAGPNSSLFIIKLIIAI